MNYLHDVTILLSPAAFTRMDDVARDVLKAFFKFQVLDDLWILARGGNVPSDQDKELVKWLVTLEYDHGEVYEVLAMGSCYEEVEHYSNKIGQDRLSVGRAACLDGDRIIIV